MPDRRRVRVIVDRVVLRNAAGTDPAAVSRALQRDLAAAIAQLPSDGLADRRRLVPALTRGVQRGAGSRFTKGGER